MYIASNYTELLQTCFLLFVLFITDSSVKQLAINWKTGGYQFYRYSLCLVYIFVFVAIPDSYVSPILEWVSFISNNNIL